MAPRNRATGLLGAIAAGVLCCATAAAPAEDIAVIVARDAPTVTLDAGTLRDVYLKKIVLDTAGRKLVPVNLPANAPLRAAFSQALFRMSDGELQDYWNQSYFHGITPPYVLASEDAVLRFVARTPGAIGYVAGCHVDTSVRTVMSLRVEAAAGGDVKGWCRPAGGG